MLPTLPTASQNMDCNIYSIMSVTRFSEHMYPHSMAYGSLGILRCYEPMFADSSYMSTFTLRMQRYMSD